jgi:hypothetical protein
MLATKVWWDLALQVADCPDTLLPEQLEASDMNPAQQDDRHFPVDLNDERRHERHTDIDRAGGEGRVDVGIYHVDVLDIGEAFALEQLLGHVLRGNANPGNICESDGGRFRRGFLSKRSRCADESCGAGRR